MSVTAMNHFTILTDDLPATLAFYEEEPGRPNRFMLGLSSLSPSLVLTLSFFLLRSRCSA